jgi:eukaryotic-like serine/threonine-protein kinase
VHRDLKPENLFVTKEGRAKILDFGLAKLQQPHSSSAHSALTVGGETEPGMVMGTVGYMSPEQVRGQSADHRADIFAFGAILYEMLNGQRAFQEPTSAETMAAILNEEPPPISQTSLQTPPGLQRVVRRCLEKNPEQRFQSTSDLAFALEALIDSDIVPGSVVDRATSRPFSRSKLKTFAVLLSVATIAMGLFYGLGRNKKLTDDDRVVLADFANLTGDPVFDGTLRQGLSAQLEQSPFLNLVSDQRIAQTLALMSQRKDIQLTSELAREVCVRTGSAAIIEGSITSLGSQYVLGLRAEDCRGGDLLVREQVTASGKEQVLKALGEAATRVRQKLGESLASVEKYDKPPENVTTSSLEALQAYSLGYRAQEVLGDFAAAIPFFERAIRLDANFAMAYSRLGTNYGNLGETSSAAENARKAYELRERVSERERFYIEENYADYATGDLEAERRTSELWAQTYPRDKTPFSNLADTYLHLGEYGRALAASEQELRLDPGSGGTYANLVLERLDLNRLDEAKAMAAEAQAHKLDSSYMHLYLYQADFLQHDEAGMEREASTLVGKPGYEDLMLYNESDTAAYAGRFVRARKLTQRAVESAERAHEKEVAGNYKAEGALREALLGNTSLARQEARGALALSRGRDAEAISAIALGLAGDSSQAMGLAGDLDRRFPEDTMVQSEYLPMVRAATILCTGAPHSAQKAIETLAPAATYELGNAPETLNFALYPAYLRGKAYLTAHQGPAAAAEFEKILDHTGVVVNEPIGAFARLGLAEALALQGDTQKAKAAYEDFLTLWKDADPDIPILKQAKAEYSKLQVIR